MQFERTVYDSLYNGETKFLTVTPVKNEDEYENGESSIFFNYLAWEHIFGEKYGNIVIPTKCYVLPLKNIKNFQYQDFLTQNFPDIAEKLKKFTTAHPKPLTRIPINPVTNKIPEELRTVADYRSVIYTNSRPLYFILTSFGLVDGSLKKQNRLYSDTYGWIRKALDYLQWGVRTFRHYRCCGSNTQFRHCKSLSNVLEYLIPVIEREHIT